MAILTEVNGKIKEQTRRVISICNQETSVAFTPGKSQVDPVGERANREAKYAPRNLHIIQITVDGFITQSLPITKILYRTYLRSLPIHIKLISIYFMNPIIRVIPVTPFSYSFNSMAH